MPTMTEALSEIGYMHKALDEAIKWSNQADGTLKTLPRGGPLSHDLYCVHLTLLAAREQVMSVIQRAAPHAH